MLAVAVPISETFVLTASVEGLTKYTNVQDLSSSKGDMILFCGLGSAVSLSLSIGLSLAFSGSLSGFLWVSLWLSHLSPSASFLTLCFLLQKLLCSSGAIM